METLEGGRRVIVRRRGPGESPGNGSPPLRLEFQSSDQKLLQKIRERAPHFGSLDLRIIYQDGRPIDVIFITGEDRVRLE